MASESFPRAMVDYNSILPMILVGGLGTRLHAIVSDRQKVIAQINGKPFLTFILDQLAESGFKHVMLCAGYKAEQIQALVGITYRCLRIQYSIEGTAAGTGGAIRNALELTGSERKHILAMNGDSYLRIQLREFIKWYFDNNTRPSIALTTVKDVSRYGSIEIDENNSILQFSEKKQCNRPGWINAGIYIFPKSILEKMPGTKPYSLETEFLPSLIKDGLLGYRCDGDFIDIGTPESFVQAQDFFKRLKP